MSFYLSSLCHLKFPETESGKLRLIIDKSNAEPDIKTSKLSWYAIRISGKNFGFKNNIKSVPLYAVGCIKPE